MTFLLTVFGIACVGVVILLGSKRIEEKSGRRFFLPEWLASRDEDIRRTAMFYTRTVAWLIKHRVRILVHMLYRRATTTAERIGTGRRMRPSGALEKSGSASTYMQDIASHKETARRENGHTE